MVSFYFCFKGKLPVNYMEHRLEWGENYKETKVSVQERMRSSRDKTGLKSSPVGACFSLSSNQSALPLTSRQLKLQRLSEKSFLTEFS